MAGVNHNLDQLFGVGALAHRGLTPFTGGLCGDLSPHHHHDPNKMLPNSAFWVMVGCSTSSMYVAFLAVLWRGMNMLSFFGDDTPTPSDGEYVCGSACGFAGLWVHVFLEYVNMAVLKCARAPGPSGDREGTPLMSSWG